MVETNPDFNLKGARKPSHPGQKLILTEDMAVVKPFKFICSTICSEILPSDFKEMSECATLVCKKCIDKW